MPRMAKPLQDRSSQLRVALVIGVIALIVSVGRVWPVGQWTLLLGERIRGGGFEGGLTFIGVYVVAEIALVPGSLLTMAAGFAYGPPRLARSTARSAATASNSSCSCGSHQSSPSTS